MEGGTTDSVKDRTPGIFTFTWQHDPLLPYTTKNEICWSHTGFLCHTDFDDFVDRKSSLFKYIL